MAENTTCQPEVQTDPLGPHEVQKDPLRPLLIVVSVVFPILWVWVGSMVAIYLGYHRTKPILQQTLIDLINADFARLHLSAATVAIVIGTTDYFDRAGWWTPEVIFLVTTWVFQFNLQVNMMYICYGIIVRYIYVFKKNMVLFEEISDRSVRNGIRAVSAGLSAILSLVLFVHDRWPEGYIPYAERRWCSITYGNAGVVFPLLTLVALAINIALRVVMWREAKKSPIPSSQHGGNQERMVAAAKKALPILVALTIAQLSRVYLLGKFLVPTSQVSASSQRLANVCPRDNSFPVHCRHHDHHSERHPDGHNRQRRAHEELCQDQVQGNPGQVQVEGGHLEGKGGAHPANHNSSKQRPSVISNETKAWNFV